MKHHDPKAANHPKGFARKSRRPDLSTCPESMGGELPDLADDEQPSGGYAHHGRDGREKDTRPPSCPEPIRYIESWGPVRLAGVRVLVLPDLHVPYHDRAAVKCAVAHGKRFGVDEIVLNGDQCDCYSISKFNPHPKKKDLVKEIETLKALLTWLRAEFPKATITYKMGNHDERFLDFLIGRAPELIGIKDFEWASVLHLEENRIDTVDDKRPIYAGDLTILHGHEYRFAISNPVSPARGLFLRAKANAMCSHFHQPSYHPGKNVRDGGIACWSTGCLCDLHPRYAPYNEWRHGFATVELSNSGKFEVQNCVIAGGKIYGS